MKRNHKVEIPQNPKPIPLYQIRLATTERSMARLLRLSIAKGLCSDGLFPRDQALKFVSGSLLPGDPSSVVDDSELFDLQFLDARIKIMESEAK